MEFTSGLLSGRARVQLRIWPAHSPWTKLPFAGQVKLCDYCTNLPTNLPQADARLVKRPRRWHKSSSPIHLSHRTGKKTSLPIRTYLFHRQNVPRGQCPSGLCWSINLFWANKKTFQALSNIITANCILRELE